MTPTSRYVQAPSRSLSRVRMDSRLGTSMTPLPYTAAPRPKTTAAIVGARRPRRQRNHAPTNAATARRSGSSFTWGAYGGVGSGRGVPGAAQPAADGARVLG